jgi:hypothetical protein
VPCQSDRKLPARAAAALAALLAAPTIAGPVNWAHQATGFQSNGAVTVKSLAGGSYSSTQNPTGAVAKANQNSSTQPPTVIIQATGSSYAQTIPLIAGSFSGSSTVPAVPTCPSGYNSVFSTSGSGLFQPIFNVGGTRWSLSFTYNSVNSNYFLAWAADGPLLGSAGVYTTSNMYGVQISGTTGTPYGWAANLCSK